MLIPLRDARTLPLADTTPMGGAVCDGCGERRVYCGIGLARVRETLAAEGWEERGGRLACARCIIPNGTVS